MRTREEIDNAFAPREALEGRSGAFLVGIGGAGMSGVAQMLLHRGLRVRGTDSTKSENVAMLRGLGIEVSVGHSGAEIRPDDALVLSDAIDLKTSVEVARARELGCPLLRRSQVLGWLLKGKKTIAVAGSHGKTTTTGMVAVGLRAAGLDPTVVVGAEVPELGGSVVEGSGEWAVVEACEAYDSLRDFDPYVAVLTNLELDHIDFHGSWGNLKACVGRFLARVPADGRILFCAEDAGARELAEGKGTPYSASDFGEEPALPGAHNRQNAAAALAVARVVGADVEAAGKAIAEFRGAHRRCELVYDGSVTVIDDYAHHPTEISSTLSALKERYAGRRLVVVFQPHLYSRTQNLIKEFAESLSLADLVVLTDIYPAREEPIPGVSSLRIAERVTKPVQYVPCRHLLPLTVKRLCRPGDVVVGMGAGNISEFAPALVADLRRTGPMRVAVVYGGESPEREVSLHSGRAVHGALVRKGYDARLVDFSELLLGKGDVSSVIGENRPDVAFLAIHGVNAEDGALQGLLELLHIPYTGPGIRASAVAIDKEMTKRMLADAGLPVPRGVVVRRGQPVPEFDIEPPLVVKPNSQGSTVGLTFVDRADQVEEAIARALQYDAEALVEEMVKGIEISVPVLGERVFPAVEIVPTSGRYDFESKYVPGATTEICPARISSEQARVAAEYAYRANVALGCVGLTRTDMIVTDDRIVVLEVNTLPGMTATSLAPTSAASVGVPFDDFVEMILEDALSRHAQGTP